MVMLRLPWLLRDCPNSCPLLDTASSCKQAARRYELLLLQGAMLLLL
jgi:hypothetical protein